MIIRLYLFFAQRSMWLWRIILQKRMSKGKDTVLSIQQKLSEQFPTHPQGRVVWGHAVGVGEALSLLGLFLHMARLRPELTFLLTSSSRTSGDVLARVVLPKNIIVQFAPVDCGVAVQRFLDYWQPVLAIWCEMDLWPLLLHQVVERDIPRVLVNARLSVEAARKKQFVSFLYRFFLSKFSSIWVQNETTRVGLIGLGAPSSIIQLTGTIKAFADPLPYNEVQANEWLSLLDTQSRPVWLVASSHPEDEEWAISAHEQLRQFYPNALLIIAPRYPHRGGVVCEYVSRKTKVNAPMRSQGQMLSKDEPYYIADTIGEMGLWYRIVPIVLMGGSIEPVGGHNPYEPLNLGARVMHGVNVWNFSEVYSELSEEGFTLLVHSVAEMVSMVSICWQETIINKSGASLRQVGREQELIDDLLSRIPIVNS